MVSSADCRSAVFDCGGSIPFLPTTHLEITKKSNETNGRNGLAHVAQLAEHVIGNDEVTGSSPVVGSTTWWKAESSTLIATVEKTETIRDGKGEV